jgi:D-inositol-3-phosphate glycosyltransferase
MSHLRLALLSYHSCPLGKLGGKDTGGMNVYVRELAANLGKRGHSIDVFTRLHDADEPQIKGLGENARLIHIKAGATESVNKLLLHSHLAEFTSTLEDFRTRNELEYDLIFSHYWLSGQAGNILHGWWQVPHMTMFHTLGMVKNGLEMVEDEPQLRLETEKNIIRECDRIIASTEHEKTLLSTEFGVSIDKITVIPCGVNLELFKPMARREARHNIGVNETGKIILFVGRLEKLKAIDRLIEAVGFLKDIPDISLFIVGGDEQSREEMQRLQHKATLLGLQKVVHFFKSIPQENLPDYYSAADVLVLPSYYESFGMVVLEALACGTPVVASNQGNLMNIIRDGKTGFVTSGNAPKLLSEKLRIILSGAGLSSPELIRESVLGYGWEKIAELVANACEKELLGHCQRVMT